MFPGVQPRRRPISLVHDSACGLPENVPPGARDLHVPGAVSGICNAVYVVEKDEVGRFLVTGHFARTHGQATRLTMRQWDL